MPKPPFLIRPTNICSLPMGIELCPWDYAILSNLGGEEYEKLKGKLNFLKNEKQMKQGNAVEALERAQAEINRLKDSYDVWILPYQATKPFDEICDKNAWKKAFNPPELTNRLEKKDELVNLFGEVDFLPQSEVYNYANANYLNFQKQWGTKFVAQFIPQNAAQQPSGGKSTFFIESKEDFLNFKTQITETDLIRISQFIEGDSCFMNAAISSDKKVFHTGIFRQIIGVSELAPSPEIYAGLDCGATLNYSIKIKEQANQIIKIVAQKLSALGYRGYFGIDLIADFKAEKAYLIEINPRFVGSTGIVNHLHFKQNLFSLLNCHIRFFLGEKEKAEPETINPSLCVDLAGANLIFRFDGTEEATVSQTPQTGIYNLNGNSVEFLRAGWNPQELKNENEILIWGIVPEGYQIQPQERMVNLFTYAEVSQSSYQLTEKYQKAVKYFKNQFSYK